MSSPLFFNFIRIYGVAEFIFGYTFTDPEDNDTPETYINKYGKNFTFGALGSGGIEFYTSKWTAFFIEVGGRVINIKF